jgi:hypothetical protein
LKQPVSYTVALHSTDDAQTGRLLKSVFEPEGLQEIVFRKQTELEIGADMRSKQKGQRPLGWKNDFRYNDVTRKILLTS